MYFDSLQAALSMDGHGAYVWTAYLMTLLVLAIMLILPIRRQKALLREVAGSARRAQGKPGNEQEEV
jgi:heme exporter protein D